MDHAKPQPKIFRAPACLEISRSTQPYVRRRAWTDHHKSAGGVTSWIVGPWCHRPVTSHLGSCDHHTCDGVIRHTSPADIALARSTNGPLSVRSLLGASYKCLPRSSVVPGVKSSILFNWRRQIVLVYNQISEINTRFPQIFLLCVHGLFSRRRCQ